MVGNRVRFKVSDRFKHRARVRVSNRLGVRGCDCIKARVRDSFKDTVRVRVIFIIGVKVRV